MLRSVPDPRVYCGRCHVKMGSTETFYVFRGDPWHEQCFIEALVRAIQVFEPGFRITNQRVLRQKALELYRQFVVQREFEVAKMSFKLADLKSSLAAAKDLDGEEVVKLREKLGAEIARLESFTLMRDALEQVFKKDLSAVRDEARRAKVGREVSVAAVSI